MRDKRLDPEAFAALAEIVSAYYMNVKVRKRIGYPGQKSPTATIAANAHRCVGHLIETANVQAVPA